MLKSCIGCFVAIVLVLFACSSSYAEEDQKEKEVPKIEDVHYICVKGLLFVVYKNDIEQLFDGWTTSCPVKCENIGEYTK